jgi:hypothetical protein
MAEPAPFELVPLTVAGRKVFVSPAAAQFPLAAIASALAEHGLGTHGRETKHRTRGGTLLIATSPGRVVVATTPEMRALRQGLSTHSPTRVKRSAGSGLPLYSSRGQAGTPKLPKE